MSKTQSFYCENCNTKLSKGSQTCTKCGHKNIDNSLKIENISSNLTYLICECGYPTIPNTKECPNCKKIFIPAGQKVKNTINKSLLKLKPIGINKNKYSEIKIINESQTISRKDIDETDLFISSDKHLKFFKKDDKWYIKNLSSNKSVYIRVDKNTVINNNDILLLGQNKLYEIKLEEE